MANGDQRAAKIYETIGVYLGYTLAHYADFYDFKRALILGRVTTGGGGDIVLDKAREVLSREFPTVAKQITLHVPDEKSRRVGPGSAAASCLPNDTSNFSHRKLHQSHGADFPCRTASPRPRRVERASRISASARIRMIWNSWRSTASLNVLPARRNGLAA